jgi:hypothetical protein
LKNAVFWDVAPCRSCVNQRFGGTSVHTRFARRHIPEDGILHSHHCGNLKSYDSSSFSLSLLYGLDVHRLPVPFVILKSYLNLFTFVNFQSSLIRDHKCPMYLTPQRRVAWCGGIDLKVLYRSLRTSKTPNSKRLYWGVKSPSCRYVQKEISL